MTHLLRLAILPVAALLGVSCGGDSAPTTSPPPAPTPAPPAPPPSAPVPPGVPSGLRVSASGEDFIEWTWNAVEGADGYDVQFSLDETFDSADEIIGRTADQTSFRRQPLAAESTAFLRVRAHAGAGEERLESDWSTHVTGMTLSPEPPPPPAPTGLRVSDRGEDFIEWTWNAVEGADGYDAQFSLDETFDSADEIIGRTADQTSFRRQPLPAESTAFLRVRAHAGAGEERLESDWSTHVTGMTLSPEPPPPPAPTGLRVSDRGEDFIEWTWDEVEGADGYDVQFSANEVFTSGDEIIARTGEELSYRRGGFSAGTSAHLRVRSASGSGDDRITSDWSTHVTGMTAAPEHSDRAVLVALYEALDGPNWGNREDWLTDAPLENWYGVRTDFSGRVTELVLRENNLTGSIPPQLGSLASLRFLRLEFNNLSGPIPAELGNLADLRELVLLDNDLTGPIPEQLGSLAKLASLSLGHNDLSGPIPPALGNLVNLRSLNLDNNDLTGPIPPEFGNLTNLGVLALWGNGLSGSIPPELGKLTEVWLLRLFGNDLSGPIPPELGDMTSLQVLRLDGNELTGPIPPELGNLSNLERLVLWNNRLTGPIPPELGNLSALTELALGGNNLTGEFPAFLLNLPRLEALFLGTAFCAPADPGVRARLRELETDLFPCPSTGERLLPSALMREDGNGMSLALPDNLRTPSGVTVSDPSVVDASVADGWLKLSPRWIGSAEVRVSSAAGSDSAVAHVQVREAVGTFGIDILMDQPVPFGYEDAVVEAADWWSDILDGTEWPDREAGCPTWDPFDGKVKALADELLVAIRIEELEGGAGYAAGCFFPLGGGREVPALDPGGGYVVTGGFGSQGLLRHEIGHLLGLVSWRSEEGLATSDCRFFTGPQAVRAFRAGGGDPGLPGVPIQTGCRSHWHEDIVDYELMGPGGGWDANSISLGALVDAGYTVDLSKALPWPFDPDSGTQAAGEGFARGVVLREPRVFVEPRPRGPLR